MMKIALPLLILAAAVALSLYVGVTKVDESRGAPSLEMLIEAFHEAHLNQDIEAAKELFYWKDAPGFVRDTVEKALQQYFGGLILELELAEVSDLQSYEFEFENTTYMPNLPAIKQLNIHYELQEGEDFTLLSSTYLIGERDGTYWISMSAPVQEAQ